MNELANGQRAFSHVNQEGVDAGNRGWAKIRQNATSGQDERAFNWFKDGYFLTSNGHNLRGLSQTNPFRMENQIAIYHTTDGRVSLSVQFNQETVWLTQAQMVELFQTTKQNVSLHIRNLFQKGELVEDAVVKDYLITATDGKAYRTKHYNLDVIISVGYRVKSKRRTQFRQWATLIN